LRPRGPTKIHRGRYNRGARKKSLKEKIGCTPKKFIEGATEKATRGNNHKTGSPKRAKKPGQEID